MIIRKYSTKIGGVSDFVVNCSTKTTEYDCAAKENSELTIMLLHFG